MNRVARQIRYQTYLWWLRQALLVGIDEADIAALVLVFHHGHRNPPVGDLLHALTLLAESADIDVSSWRDSPFAAEAA